VKKPPRGVPVADAKRLLLGLPDVVEGTSYGMPSFLLNGRFLARFRDDDTVLVLQLGSIGDRDVLMQLEPKAFFFTDHYRDYPRRCAPGFRTLFATLSDGTHRPLVFHCTAGKDRTGFASALLLSLLGVPWDHVMEDYLRTNDLWTGHIGRYPELDIDTRAAIIEARRPYLEAAFDVVRADFGSPEAFAEKALGLDAKARERLRADLLE